MEGRLKEKPFGWFQQYGLVYNSSCDSQDYCDLKYIYLQWINFIVLLFQF
jgi:hypothetical protein